MRDDERCRRSKEVNRPELVGQVKNFMDKDRCVSIQTISGGMLALPDPRKLHRANPPTNF